MIAPILAIILIVGQPTYTIATVSFRWKEVEVPPAASVSVSTGGQQYVVFKRRRTVTHYYIHVSWCVKDRLSDSACVRYDAGDVEVSADVWKKQEPGTGYGWESGMKGH